MIKKNPLITKGKLILLWKSKQIFINKYILFIFYRDEEKVESRNKPKSINMMKDVRKLYQHYCPQILKDNHGFKYNLSEESIFGNLYYSMNQDFLKGKSVDYQSIPNYRNYSNYRRGPVKLIPILRFKKVGIK